MKRIVFCTTCKDRTQHIKWTLPHNLADNPRSRFVILNYGSGDGLLDYLASTHRRAILSGHLSIYSCFGSGPFRMAHAKNMAHRCGMLEGAEILCNLDADNLTGAGFEDYISWMFDTPLYPDLFLRRGGQRGASRGTNGRIAVSARNFLKVGGYDERYANWGPDDEDYSLRLGNLGCEAVPIDSRFLRGVQHGDWVRFRDYPYVTYEDALREFDAARKRAARTSAVRNAGRIGCGTVYKGFDLDRPITLPSLPTRIFGVGMHRTGTTSLHHALRVLGYDSWQWNALSATRSARRIWDEMRGVGYSRTLERFEALADLPIPLLYRDLDRAYPGSRFVLTVRDERQWLDSVGRHWRKYRAGWDYDGFSHNIHRALYGREEFDASVFLARYRRHNAEVMDYFSGRSDLLVMDMDDGDGWGALCGFLGAPRPEAPYPRENVSEMREEN